MCPRLLALAAILGVLPNIASPQQPATGNYIIAGVVVQHLSDRPLKNVRVTIIRNGHPDQQLTVATAEDGRFSFTDLPADKYSLTAEYRGVAHFYKQHEQFSTGIVAGPGLDTGHIEFLLPAPAGLAVTILDDEGDPVKNAELFLLQKKVSYGWEQIVMGPAGNTDSGGLHRFAHLEPGTYFVAVEAQPWYAQHQTGPNQPATEQQLTMSSELDVAYPLTYYSGAIDPSGATPITVTEGNTSQVQITLHAVPALHLAIAGANPQAEAQPTGAPPQPVDPPPMPQLSIIGPGGVLLPHTAGYTMMNNNGQQELVGVPPGHYVISMMRFHGGPNPAGPETMGAMKADLSSNSKLDPSALSRTSISGKVLFEGSQRPNAVMLSFSNVQNGQGPMTPVKQDGSFEVENPNGGTIPPGAYEIRLLNAPGLYIKSIAVKGMNYSGGMVDVQEGASAHITIVAARGEVALKGIALQDGKPFSGAMVLLVPKDRNQSTFIPRDQSDSDGTFELQGAHPGRYTLIAIDDGSDLAYQERGALAPYLDGGQIVDVPAAEGAAVQANVQKRVR